VSCDELAIFWVSDFPGLGKIAELERPRRHPKAFGTSSNLLPLRASRALAPTHVARKKCLQWLAVQQPSNQGGAYAPV
jgi:hypothetical protein